ncbi:hypothetical protein [Pseudonocardia acaciae]|uniref:hypothetical protein n=1 Tax=Pseudonocardia acaciae TaxID=551276 RepID=UPI001B80BD3F|nr:hypothetical protein [Pseudonocardia acaciae]
MGSDDLCTVPEARGQGHAGALLRWVDEEAQRHAAHRRYLTSGFHIPALHFGKSV